MRQTRLAGLDLQREVLRVDARLREAAGDEPESGLRGAREHVAQLLAVAESPDRADARRDFLAEELAHQRFLAFPAGGEDDQIRTQGLAAAQPRAFGNELGYV